jgi:hypothetical protein
MPERPRESGHDLYLRFVPVRHEARRLVSVYGAILEGWRWGQSPAKVSLPPVRLNSLKAGKNTGKATFFGAAQSPIFRHTEPKVGLLDGLRCILTPRIRELTGNCGNSVGKPGKPRVLGRLAIIRSQISGKCFARNRNGRTLGRKRNTGRKSFQWSPNSVCQSIRDTG